MQWQLPPNHPKQVLFGIVGPPNRDDFKLSKHRNYKLETDVRANSKTRGPCSRCVLIGSYVMSGPELHNFEWSG